MDLVRPRFAVVPSDLESELAGDPFYRRGAGSFGQRSTFSFTKVES